MLTYEVAKMFILSYYQKNNKIKLRSVAYLITHHNMGEFSHKVISTTRTI